MASLRMPIQRRLLSLGLTTSRAHFLGCLSIREGVQCRNYTIRKTRQEKNEEKFLEPRTGVYARSIAMVKIPRRRMRSEILELLTSKGFEVKDLKMRVDRFLLENNGACWVELGSEEQADQAIKDLDMMMWQDRQLRVRPMGQGYSFDTPTEGRLIMDDGSDIARQAVLPLIEGRRLALRVYAPGWGVGKTTYGNQAKRYRDIVKQTFDKYSVEAVSKMHPYWGPLSGELQHRAMAFIDFKTTEAADQAIAELHDTEVFDRKIILKKHLLAHVAAAQLGKMDEAVLEEVRELGLLAPEEEAESEKPEGDKE